MKGPNADASRGYAPLLEELQKLYPTLTRNPPPWREGYKQVGHLAHGWYLRCHRGVEAILRLDQSGYAEEASPIRRSVIEHVLALRWLSVEGDKILDTLAGGHARNAQQILDATKDAGWTSIDFEAIKEIVANANPPDRDRHNDNLLHWNDRLAKYGDKYSTPGYIAETARTHPTYESAICYVELPDGGLLSASRDRIWQVPFCTTHLLEALLAVRDAFDPSPWESELERIIERYRSVTDAVRREDGMPAIDWSTGTTSSS
jgi:Family of unknown function (DUF5677)